MTLPADGWLTQDYNAIKKWPTHVKPSKVTIRTEQPTQTMMSQSLIRFSRTNGNFRTIFDLEYPPMTLREFGAFRAVIQACQGQWNILSLPLDVIRTRPYDEIHEPVSTIGTTTSLIPAGSTLFNLSGLDANDAYAVEQGQFISISNPALGNGYLAMVLATQASDAEGNVEFRITHPVKSAIPAGTVVSTRPTSVVVSVLSDQHDYDISTSKYYYLKISFISTNYTNAPPDPIAEPVCAVTIDVISSIES